MVTRYTAVLMRRPRPEQKAAFKKLTAASVTAAELAGSPITAVHTQAPGNGAAIGGIKVSTEQGWFAARPSGTEDIYKIYAESFAGENHLQQLIDEGQSLIKRNSIAIGLLLTPIFVTYQEPCHADQLSRSHC